MKAKLSYYLLSCICFFVLLSGCSKQPATVALDPEALYTAAAVQLTGDQAYTVIHNKLTQHGDQVILETTRQAITYQNLHSPQFAAAVEEAITIGSYNISVVNQFIDETAYVQVGGSSFSGAMTADAFTRQYPPFALPDATLYQQILVQENYGRIMLGFSEPSAPEAWAMPSNAIFLDAAGSVVLGPDGTLKQINYGIQYQYGQICITESYRISPAPQIGEAIAVPADTTQFTHLDTVHAPILLEKACGYLLAAQGVSTAVSEETSSQLDPVSRTQTIQLQLSGKDESLSALIETGATLVNHSRDGETTVLQQTERFQDGIYTIQANGSAEHVQEDVTAQALQDYCKRILVGNIPMPHFITTATITEQDGTIVFHFDGSDELAAAVCTNISQSLYQESSLLASLTDSSTTQDISGYLQLDAITGLPMACGLSYNGDHVIEGTTYRIHTQLNQTFSLIDKVF